MKKVLLSAVLLLASSGAAVFAATTTQQAPGMPEATLAAPVMTDEHHKDGHHGMAHMTKEEIIAKLTKKGEEVSKSGATLTGVEKELFDAAMARFNAWVKVIGEFADKDTNPALSGKRAQHELRLAKAIAHHKDGFPAEKVAKWKSDFETLKADVSKLNGDTKAVGTLLAANIEELFSNAEKAKDTTMLPLLLNALKYRIYSLKTVLHHAEHKTETPVAMTAAPGTDAKTTPSTESVKQATETVKQEDAKAM